MRLILPTYFSEREAHQFAKTAYNLLLAPELRLQIGAITFAHPFATLVIGQTIRDILLIRKDLQLPTTLEPITERTPAIAYLRFCRFFEFIGYQEALPHAIPSGNSNYLPVRTISRDSMSPKSRSEVLQEKIEKESENLAKVIFPSADQYSQQTMVAYAFRELIRNTFEHGQVDSCTIMAQSWANGFSEIAICDNGIGIHKSLSEIFPTLTAPESLRFSLKAGVTCKANVETGSEWDNSGFGLYIISQLGFPHAGFSLVSSGHLLNHPHADPVATKLPGTALKLRIPTSDAEYWPNILSTLAKQGDDEARTTPGAIIREGRRKSNSWSA